LNIVYDWTFTNGEIFNWHISRVVQEFHKHLIMAYVGEVILLLILQCQSCLLLASVRLIPREDFHRYGILIVACAEMKL
jgi:hypothetical protein